MPTISGITGAVTHGQSITITGTGFGTKSVAAPVVWDDASGPADVLNIWETGQPSGSTNPELDTQRRSEGYRGVPAPHNRVGRYIAGAHGEDLGHGGSVSIIKNFAANPSVTPFDLYVSYWQHVDLGWVFGGDNNFKSWQYGPGTLPMAGAVIAGSYGAHFPQSLSDFCKWQVATQQDGDTMMQEGTSFHVNGPGSPLPLMPFGQWIKYEIIARMGASGYIRVYENGGLRFGYTGRTDVHAASMRRFGIGNYARQYNQPANVRYFADCYIDTSHQRVMLGNAPTLNASCTIREVQIPTTWSDTSVTVDVNRGVLGDDEPVYVFVVDGSDVSSDGFLVEAAPVEAPPVITSALSVFVSVGATDPYSIVANNAPTSFAASPLPSGRTVNASTGEITGTYNELGFTETVVTATNAFGTDQKTVAFDVSQDAVVGIEEPVNIGTSSNKSDTTLSVTTQTIVPTGNTILVLVSCRGGTVSTGIPTCSDNVSFAQYERDVYQTNADGSRKAALFRYSNNVELPVGSVITVSIDGGIGDAKAMTAFWVRGLDLISPVDVFSSAVTEVSTTTPNSGQITTT